MKREQTIENLYQLAQLTQQVQADRIEIVLEERRDEHFPPMSKALMETRSGLTRRKMKLSLRWKKRDINLPKITRITTLSLFPKRIC